MRWPSLILGALLVAACIPAARPPAVPWLDRVPEPDEAAIASQPVVAQDPDSITLMPISPRGATVGVGYAYDMPHCGIKGTIDVDGSFWDAVRIDPDSVEFDGAPGRFRLTTPTTAVFTTTDGRSLDLVRHDGAKAFPFCQ